MNFDVIKNDMKDRIDDDFIDVYGFSFTFQDFS